MTWRALLVADPIYNHAKPASKATLREAADDEVWQACKCGSGIVSSMKAGHNLQSQTIIYCSTLLNFI